MLIECFKKLVDTKSIKKQFGTNVLLVCLVEETTPMPGPDMSGEEEETDTIDQEYEEEDSGDTVIISPTFSFKCEAAGIFPHRSDKQHDFFHLLFHIKDTLAVSHHSF